MPEGGNSVIFCNESSHYVEVIKKSLGFSLSCRFFPMKPSISLFYDVKPFSLYYVVSFPNEALNFSLL